MTGRNFGLISYLIEQQAAIYILIVNIAPRKTLTNIAEIYK